MPPHDEYARITPYELAFAEPERIEELGHRVRQDETARGVDPTELQHFLGSAAVAAIIRELEVAESGSGTVYELGVLLYHGVHFAEAGRRLYLLTVPVARYLVDGEPPGLPEPPASAGYLQFPQHLFWAEGTGDAGPESVDGVSWTATRAGLLQVLAVTGMRPDRPGLGIVPLPEVPLGDAELWLAASTREVGDDFRSTLPGSELDGLYSFQTAGEILKLLARFFAYVEGTPGCVARKASAPLGSIPPPSRFECERVTLSRSLTNG